MTLGLLLVVAAAAQMGTGSIGTISGQIPPRLLSPSYATWIAADGDQRDVGCALAPPATWRCERVPGGARGLVVIVGANGEVAAVPTGPEDAAGSSVIGNWGRAVRFTAGGVAPDDLHDIRATVWKPERPSTRISTRRFLATPETNVTLVRLGPTAYWITGGSTDADAFVQFDGPAIATMRVSIAVLAGGPPDTPVFAMAEAPFALTGRVIDRRDQDVEHVAVELWEPLPSDADQPREHLDVWIRRATTLTDAQGAFTFERLAAGGYQVTAIDGSHGRATAIIRSVVDPVVLRLDPPASASGRVLRSGIPLGGVRVRFVPDAAALAASADPRVHLSDETTTGEDGRFDLSLPPSRLGVVQVLTPEGSSVRISLPVQAKAQQIALGDVVVPDTRHVTLHLLDQRRCELNAVGPMGQVGLTTVRATPGASNVYWIELPEPGTWVLNARCDDRDYAVDPPMITIAGDGPDSTVDLRIPG